MSTFDIKKFLVENKLTFNSRRLQEIDVPSNIQNDSRYQNRPMLDEKVVVNMITDYLDTFKVDSFVEKYYDPDYGPMRSMISPIGNVENWNKNSFEASDVVEYFLRKKHPSWLEDIFSGDDVGEEISKLYVQEFVQIAQTSTFDLEQYIADRFE